MKIPFLAALTAAMLILSAPTAAFAEPAPSRGPGAAGGKTLHLDPAGRKWATDDVLRQSMAGINRAMRRALPEIGRRRFGAADYRGLAEEIQQQVGEIAENCALGQEADAVLQRVVGELASGAEMMEEARSATRHAGARRVVRALQSYGRYFRHPGWKAAGN